MEGPEACIPTKIVIQRNIKFLGEFQRLLSTLKIFYDVEIAELHT